VPPRRYTHVLPSGTGQRTAYLWNEAGASWLSIADAATGQVTPPTRLDLDVQKQAYVPASWRPDGRRLVVNDFELIAIVDGQTGKVLKTHRMQALSVAYIDHGKRIVSGGHEGSLYFDGDLTPVGGTPDFVADCCTTSSPDGETAVLFEEGLRGATMSWRIIRAATGELVREGKLPTWVNSAASSPDGRLIAGTGTDGVFTIDTSSGAFKSAPPTGHRAEGVSIRFSPDGTRLVSGAADGTVTLWNARTLDNLLTVATADESTPIPVAPIFARGDDVVSIPSYDGKTYHWDTSTSRILNQACVMAGRNLTAGEWARMFPNLHYQETCP
jgi:WD40 repeat protein